MALTKIINDESKSFRPVLTDKLVLDAVPTEGSFNGVTSDGVAKAIAEGGGGSYTSGDGIAISEGEISAKVDGETIGVNADGELEALGGGGSDLEAGTAIKIENNKISVNYDGDALTLKTDTVHSHYNSYDEATRTISFDGVSISGSTKCDWGFGKDGGSSFTITATAEQAGCQLRCALYDSNAQLLSVSSHGVVSWGMPKMLYEGTNNFMGVQWESSVRPSGRTFADEFPLAEGKRYQDSALIALVAYNTTSNEVVGNPFTLPSDSDFEFVIETDANSRITVLCNPNSLEVQSPLGLSVKNPVPSTYGMPQGSVLTIGEYGIAWEQPSGGGDVFVATVDSTSYQDVKDAYDAGKVIIAKDGNTIYTLGRWSLAGGFEFFYASVPNNRQIAVYQYTLSAAVFWSRIDCTPIPYYNGASDAGKVLTIGSDGFLTWTTP